MDEDRFTKIMVSVVASLITAAVVGGIAMSGQINRLDERVKGLDDRLAVWNKTNADRLDLATRQIDQITKDQRESDRRIGVIEGRIRAN